MRCGDRYTNALPFRNLEVACWNEVKKDVEAEAERVVNAKKEGKMHITEE